jgi:2-oxoglutarate dehydrogenase E1 component
MALPTVDVNPQNLAYIEDLYQQYCADPAGVPAEWQAYFGHWNGREPVRIGPAMRSPGYFELAADSSPVASTVAPRPAAKPAPSTAAPVAGVGASVASPTVDARLAQETKLAALQDRADQVIRRYRMRGHMVANLDPLGLPRTRQAEVDLDHDQFTDEELDTPLSSLTIAGEDVRTLRQIVQRMRNTYCRSIGAQFMHIDDWEIREWLQQRMEGTENRIKLAHAEQIRILQRLTDATLFERFLHEKWVGAKTFSLEGGETLIPLLDLAIEKAADQGVKEIVLGMAHRGRLNVLANIMHKELRAIFREFDDRDPARYHGAGDVKYHLGYSSDWISAMGRKVHLSLCFNPSHLEFINPVAMGRVRAKMDRSGDLHQERGMCLLIHGDAAFAGEGVIQETLNLSELPGYKIGGTLHVIVNNQIGFTTEPFEGRSTGYATDVAKMLQSPIFHVNGEDPEAVAQVVQLAMDFRAKFKRDVVIDMYCYRLYGHNEGDEPMFTQPVLYEAIRKRKTVRDSYLDYLLKMGEVTAEEADRIARQATEKLDKELAIARSDQYTPVTDTLKQYWSGYEGGPWSQVKAVDTSVAVDQLAALLRKTAEVPANFNANAKIQKMLDTRRQMAEGKAALDWAAAEAAAFASLASQGVRIRLTGQDCVRGTFSHRHAGLTDQKTGLRHFPLKHLAEDQGLIDIHNSPLSEIGVLGFEYGYSLDCPEGLVLWEAQFGDFVNVAQVIIDQFLVSGEDKWRRLSGLTLLLPHGYEGAGPEHSSARLERFLNLCAEDNIQVVYPTTPAQYFHLLRRQVLNRWRKPLVVMTPKSLLRHPKVVSTLEETAKASFQVVLGDPQVRGRDASGVLICSGKIYYELLDAREKEKRADLAILRLEQLYPFPAEQLKAALAGVADAVPVAWVQEEPANMGGWRFFRDQGCPRERLFDRWALTPITRAESASPATGSHASHKIEQAEVIGRAMALGRRAKGGAELVASR